MTEANDSGAVPDRSQDTAHDDEPTLALTPRDSTPRDSAPEPVGSVDAATEVFDAVTDDSGDDPGTDDPGGDDARPEATPEQDQPADPLMDSPAAATPAGPEPVSDEGAPDATAADEAAAGDGAGEEPLVRSDDDTAGAPAGGVPGRFASLNKITGARVLIALLVGLLGFTMATQWRNNSDDTEYASARQDDLLRFLADLDAREDRLRQDIQQLQATKTDLESGVANRDKILAEAEQRADDLGIMAGTEPARGPGLTVRFWDGAAPIRASHVLDAVQELRNAGAEALQIDAGGQSVRIIASTYFAQEGDGVIIVDGKRLTSPYVLTAIGHPETMSKAMKIPGGVITKVEQAKGNVIVNEHGVVDVKTVRPTPGLEYAKPVA